MLVIDALAAALRSRGIQVIEQPQAALNTNARLELWLEGFTAGGEGKTGNPLDYETMTFRADVAASGVARQFVGALRKILRTMLELGESSLDVPVTVGENAVMLLKAHFEKTSPGTFEYEDELSPMPARFRESWRITITYRATIVPEED
ncbi:MAG: DUF4783 domain-containing protein [Treponema sp.]|jgi:hypothetical protein|nr:DUF4783 domain-containing protein [Treponema sp.]